MSVISRYLRYFTFRYLPLRYSVWGRHVVVAVLPDREVLWGHLWLNVAPTNRYSPLPGDTGAN
jgi:hypothetical protein